MCDKYEEYRIFTKYTLKMARLFADGKSLTDLDQDEIDFLLNMDNDFAEISVLKGDYYAALFDFKRARDQYEDALNKKFLSGDLQRKLVINELVFISLIEKDNEIYNKYFNEDFKNFFYKFLIKLLNGYYTEYARLVLVDKDKYSAEKLKNRYLKFKKDYIFKGELEKCDELFEMVDKISKEEEE